MNRIKKAEACDRSGSKTMLNGGSSDTFSSVDYRSEPELIQDLARKRPLGKSADCETECFDCKRVARLDGYRFSLVPLCECCRTEREVEITRNRFERRWNR